MSDLYPNGCNSPYGAYHEEGKPTVCPECGEALHYDDVLYWSDASKEIVGCSHCIRLESIDNYDQD